MSSDPLLHPHGPWSIMQTFSPPRRFKPLDMAMEFGSVFESFSMSLDHP